MTHDWHLPIDCLEKEAKWNRKNCNNLKEKWWIRPHMNVLNSRGGYQKWIGWIGAAIFTSPKRNENRKKTIVRKLILLPWYYIWKSKSAFARTDGQEPRFISWNKTQSYCMGNLVTQILHTILYFQMHIEPLFPGLKMQERGDGFHKNHNELSQTKINSSSSTSQESHKFSMPILKACGPCGSASQASIWNISAQSQNIKSIIQWSTHCMSNKIYLIRILKSPLPPIKFFLSLSIIFISKITNHFDRTDKLKVGGERHLQIHTRKNIALRSLSISFWGLGCFWTAQWWWRESNCPLGYFP
jgi:hypothetical protein